SRTCDASPTSPPHPRNLAKSLRQEWASLPPCAFLFVGRGPARGGVSALPSDLHRNETQPQSSEAASTKQRRGWHPSDSGQPLPLQGPIMELAGFEPATS